MTVEAPDRLIDARDVVAELLGDAGISEPPVDLKAVAAVRGIRRVRFAPLKSAYGLLKTGPNGHTITINKRYMSRARFTLAHEIAHTLVEHFEDADDDVPLAHLKPRGAAKVEAICDEIAAEILFPYEMFQRALGDSATGIDDIQRLASLFDGSVMAAANRVGNVTAQPVQIISWVRHGSNALRAGQRSGKGFLTCSGASPYRPLDRMNSAPVRAFHSGSRERGMEVPLPEKPWNIYECEAQRFSGGKDGYVLSVVRPANLDS